MGIDLRFPIGLLFLIFGILLMFFGSFSKAADYSRSLNLNINLWWGLAMFAFGAVMFFVAYRKKSARREPTEVRVAEIFTEKSSGSQSNGSRS
jgi:membrane protein implicated in regulation of membrane protease activity